jgi:hydroxymethylpyrimidine/phosphomethylpyrimidine kinase
LPLLKSLTLPPLVVLAFKETTSVYEKRYMQLLIEKLFPFATIITPNLKEAELLIGRKLTTTEVVSLKAKTGSNTTGRPACFFKKVAICSILSSL